MVALMLAGMVVLAATGKLTAVYDPPACAVNITSYTIPGAWHQGVISDSGSTPASRTAAGR